MISIVVGKPGSGKSYEVVRSLYERFESAENLGGDLPNVFTNLRLNLDAWGKFRERITVIDDDFLFGEWWNDIPDGALVILDEAQYFLSDKRLENVEITHLEEHFSTHRHRNLEYVLITQNLTSLSQGVRRYAQTVTQINNNKNVVIPFPVNIPTRDVAILLRGFGVTRQTYWATTSDLLNSHKTDKSVSSEFHVTNKFVFGLYATNKTGAKDDMKLPFALGKGAWRRALSWFFFKHFWNFAIKFGVVAFVVIVYLRMDYRARKHLAEVNSKSSTVKVSSTGVRTDEKKENYYSFPVDDDAAAVDRLPIAFERTEY